MYSGTLTTKKHKKKHSKKVRTLFITALLKSIELLKNNSERYICDTFTEQMYQKEISREEEKTISRIFESEKPTSRKNKEFYNHPFFSKTGGLGWWKYSSFSLDISDHVECRDQRILFCKHLVKKFK